MFNSYHALDAPMNNGDGHVVHVPSPLRYPLKPPLDDPIPKGYILICDKNKFFSLIDPYLQVGLSVEGSYVKTTYMSGYYNTPAHYVQPVNSKDVGYILQSIIGTTRLTAWIGKCSLAFLDTSEYQSTKILDVPLFPARYSFFGQFGAYYPADRLALSSFKVYTVHSVAIDKFNNDSYSSNNYFYTPPPVVNADGSVEVVPVPPLSIVVNKTMLIYSVKRYDTYATISQVCPKPSNLISTNSCIASNYDIYATHADYHVSSLEVGNLAQYAYTIFYPISLLINSELLEELVVNQGEFLNNRAELVRPMFKSYHIFTYDYTYDTSTYGYMPFFSLFGFTLSAPMVSYTFTNYGVSTGKNTFFSSGMYANTDAIFADISYSPLFSACAGMRYQILRSIKNTIVIKYKPADVDIRHHLRTYSVNEQETDDLFYFFNSLNPEEHMFCDGVLFGKQQFLYSKYSPSSMLGYTMGLNYGVSGGWAPVTLAGSQNILLKGVSITFDRGLLSTSYITTAVAIDPKLPPTKYWQFIDIKIDSLSQVLGTVNRQVPPYSPLGASTLDFRDYLSSAQAPYDTIFCDGVENDAVQIPAHVLETGSTSTANAVSLGYTVVPGFLLESDTTKIPDCVLYGMTTTQGFLDAIYDKIIDLVRISVENKTISKNTSSTIVFSKDIYSILLYSDDPELMYRAATSYQYALLNSPSLGGFRIYGSQLANPPTYLTVGQAFLYGGPGFKHKMLRQKMVVTCTYEFNIDVKNKNVSVVFADFPFGACTSTIASARVNIDGVADLIPVVIKSLKINGGTPTILCDLSLNDGTGLTYPKTYTINTNNTDYIFTHSAKDIIMFDKNGNELLRHQLSCTLNGAEHTCIDRFDKLILGGIGNTMIGMYLHP